jgi:flavin reductase (DIM6/NTAB) family NADH-FMN oxidoreductase RutF
MSTASHPQMLPIAFDDLKRHEKYFLLVSTVLPRPIAIVSTLNDNGTDNLASFSYFNVVSSDPPCLMISVSAKRTGKKDTLINIEREKEFVIHVGSAEQKDLIHLTGEDLPYGQSEREKIGLTLSPSTWIKTPRVSEFPVAYECVLEKIVEIGNSHVVFGRILGGHIREDLKVGDEWKVDGTLLNPLARMEPGYGSIVDL